MVLSCSASILDQKRPAISHVRQLFPSPTAVRPSAFLFLITYVCGKHKNKRPRKIVRLFPAWRSWVRSQKSPRKFFSAACNEDWLISLAAHCVGLTTGRSFFWEPPKTSAQVSILPLFLLSCLLGPLLSDFDYGFTILQRRFPPPPFSS